MIEKLTVTIDGIEYEWCGGFGAVLISYERGVRQGTMRRIGTGNFYASRIWTRGLCGFRPPQISWLPDQEIDLTWIQQYKRELFH